MRPNSFGQTSVSALDTAGLATDAELAAAITAHAATDVELRMLLKGYWDGDTLAGSDAAAQASWTDISGNGNNFAQVTGGKQPLVKTNILNGHRVLRFDGTDDYMTFTFPAALVLPVVVLVVAKRSSSAGFVYDGSTGARIALVPFDGVHWGIYGGSTVLQSAGAFDTSWHIFAVIHDTTSKLYVDGGAAVISGSAGTNTPVGINLGISSDAATGQYVGDIASMVMLSGSSSLAVINSAARALAAKYALTWTTAT